MLTILPNFSLSLRRERVGVRVNINFPPSPASPPARGGENYVWNYLLNNSKGISVIFLIIAMLLMITIGYVFSYLIPTKQKSVRFPIYSTQALYIAQSGVEFAIRYAADQGWRGATDGIYDLNRLDGISRTVFISPMGNGTFTIRYPDPGPPILPDTLRSTGQIAGSSENRVVRVSNFLPFLRLVFALPNPCRTPPAGTVPTTPVPMPNRNRAARFYIQNVRTTSTTLTAFSASWTSTAATRLNRIYMNTGSGWNLKYNATYNTGTPPPIVDFNQASPNDQQTITPNQVVTVLIYFNVNLGNIGGGTPVRNIIVTFYTAAGDGYTFNLDAAGDGLPTC